MIREITEPKPHARLKAALIGVGSVAAMLVALIVLSPYLFPQDARPSFATSESTTKRISSVVRSK